MAIPRNLANLANQLNTDGEAPKIEVGDSSVAITDTGSNGTITFTTDNSERMRIDNLGNVGIGTTSPQNFSNYNILTVDDTTGSGAYFRVNGTNTFRILVTSGAGLLGVQTNAPMTFETNDIERARIPAAGGFQCVNSISVGNATPTTSGAGITFPATQSASSNANTLDDYEEGDWTPVLAGREGSVSGQSYSQQIGKYTKIGNVVYVVCDVTLSAEGTPGTGSSGIRGLPFTVGATNGSGMCCTTWTNTGQNYVSIVAIAIANETNAIFKVATAATNSNAVVDPPTDFFTNTTRIALMGFYYVS